MDTSPSIEKPSAWLDKPVLKNFPGFKIEHLLIALILITAILSRFYNIGARDMSHDEVNHVVPSYELYTGNGYTHDPVTHGPLQFHLIAATYFLFGDSDYASRVPSAVFGVLTIAFVLFGFRRYLGRLGSLLAGLFYLISPYMLFYERYTRNESFVALFGVIMLFCTLNYLEKGKKSTLLLLAAALSLQFCTKETAYIYTAILLIFLAIVFFNDVLRKEWDGQDTKSFFSVIMVLTFIFAGLALVAATMETKASSTTQPFKSEFLQNLLPVYHTVFIITSILAAVGIVVSIVFLLIGLGWNRVKNLRSFDLLFLTFTLILPLLTAFPVKLLGWDPLDYSSTGMIHTGIVLLLLATIAVLLGCLWKPSTWLPAAGIFYAIFTVLYTTFFTNAQGFFTGMVGSLGYWLSQQSVNRGTQPWYYYAFLQVPMYEYLAALGTVLAAVYGIKWNLFVSKSTLSPFQQAHFVEPEKDGSVNIPPLPNETANTTEMTGPVVLPVLGLLIFWSLMSLVAYSVAGEKMPWLTVHITLPMLLAAGWGLGYLIESIPWKKLAKHKGLLVIPIMILFLVSIGTTVDSLMGSVKPFSGTNLDQLQATGNFLFSILALAGSIWGLQKLLSGWNFRNSFKLMLLTFFGILSVLTARSAYQASFINYDNAKEFLVYAHGASGPKEILNQVEEISERTTGGKDIKVAYIGDALYPYWWYFRDYPNKMWIKDTISRDLQNYPLVICDDTYLSQTQSVLGDKYVVYEYKRLWWPMMDYMNVTWQQVKDGISNPEMVRAIFNIWFNKDYTLYGQITNNTNLTLETWQPSASLHFFISKDIVSQIWDYGTLPAASTNVETDPYAGKYVDLTPDQFFGQSGSENGQLNNAHGIAFAVDGSVYIADSSNNRIQHFSSTGTYLGSWGTYANIDDGNAPGGTFNEPWGVAVGPDGSVYVTDTWNYRVQKFSANGDFITMWGSAGQGETPTSFWGPRGIAVDSNGHVYVTDTGNKRVVVFDSEGNSIAQFGSGGMENGQFDEPVGIALDSSGNVYVADTWNYRIQVFAPDVAGQNFTFVRSWDVDGWTSQSAQNKPFLAVDGSNNVYVTDPENYRVLEFNGNTGEFIQGWGQYSNGIDGFGMPIGIAADSENHVWVVDAVNNFILRFTPPTSTSTALTSLPAFPNSSSALNYDPATGQLVDVVGKAFYTLDTAQNIWVPIVPDSISSTLGDSVTPVKDDLGFWYIKDSSGKVLYQWNEGALTWLAVDTTISENSGT